MILVTGANGQLSRALQKELINDELYVTSSSELNLINQNKIQILLKKINPSLIIHTAAFTKVDDAEIQKELVMEINFELTKIIANFAHKNNIPLIFFSTDYVFDGLKNTPYIEDDFREPINIYGLSKKYAEDYIVQLCEKFIIFRISWIYDLQGSNFVNTILSIIQSQNVIKVVNDQFGSPTPTFFIAKIVKKVIELTYKNSFPWGIYHLSTSGIASWYEFSKLIINNIKFINQRFNRKIHIEPVSSANYSRLANRPKYSKLCCDKIEKVLGMNMMDWKESFIQMVKINSNE